MLAVFDAQVLGQLGPVKLDVLVKLMVVDLRECQVRRRRPRAAARGYQQLTRSMVTRYCCFGGNGLKAPVEIGDQVLRVLQADA